MTKRKMTKRQLLNALLDAQMEKEKIEAAAERVSQRRKKWWAKHSDLTNELHAILKKEYEKEGKDIDDTEITPIIFKNHAFVPSKAYRSWDNSECDITPVNNVK